MLVFIQQSSKVRKKESTNIELIVKPSGRLEKKSLNVRSSKLFSLFRGAAAPPEGFGENEPIN